MTLTLVNAGTIPDEGLIDGTIEGIGALAPQTYSLAPGARVAIPYGFTVPLETPSGLHQGTFRLPGGERVALTVAVQRHCIA